MSLLMCAAGTGGKPALRPTTIFEPIGVEGLPGCYPFLLLDPDVVGSGQPVLDGLLLNLMDPAPCGAGKP